MGLAGIGTAGRSSGGGTAEPPECFFVALGLGLGLGLADGEAEELASALTDGLGDGDAEAEGLADGDAAADAEGDAEAVEAGTDPEPAVVDEQAASTAAAARRPVARVRVPTPSGYVGHPADGRSGSPS